VCIRLQTVLAALGKLTVLIDSLVISNTVIVELPAGAFADLAIKRLVLRNNGLGVITSNRMHMRPNQA
jgi:hypothetical protein